MFIMHYSLVLRLSNWTRRRIFWITEATYNLYEMNLANIRLSEHLGELGPRSDLSVSLLSPIISPAVSQLLILEAVGERYDLQSARSSLSLSLRLPVFVGACAEVVVLLLAVWLRVVKGRI